LEYHFTQAKEHELVADAKQYSLDVISISTTKRRGFNTAELDNCWKLFYSGVERASLASAGIKILVSPQLASFFDEGILLGERCACVVEAVRPLAVIDTVIRLKFKCTVREVGGRNAISTLLSVKANRSIARAF